MRSLTIAVALTLGAIALASPQELVQEQVPELAPPVPAPPRPAGAESGPETEITPAHEAAVVRGLVYLAETQNADGSWTAKVGRKLNESYDYTDDTGHVGVTSLACIAFLAGGHQPGRGKYGQVIERGLDYVLASCTEDGYITRNKTRMYSHAFSTL
ncbi:MAG: hypothetical protein P1V81_13920, partial [Planctomycetota bacterium]|nr:hypothetical protein [Planctomycetota bacterium]